MKFFKLVIMSLAFYTFAPSMSFAQNEAIKKAAFAGDAKAQYQLAYYLFENSSPIDEEIQTRGLAWYRKSAAQNYAPAQLELGRIYARGKMMVFNVGPVDEDQAVAFNWYMKAANQGLADAIYEVGECYSRGKCATKNYVTAFAWYRKAMNRGHSLAVNRMGLMTIRGMGREINYVNAYYFYSIAMAFGDGVGKESRDEVAAKMRPDQIKFAQEAVVAYLNR